MSYWQLGESEHATYAPSIIKNEIGLVHNGRETLVYNLGIPCHQDLEPAVIVPSNFILANYFLTDTRDLFDLCPTATDPTLATASVAVPTMSDGKDDIGSKLGEVVAFILALLVIWCFPVIFVIVGVITGVSKCKAVLKNR